ncbi:MAG: hypothetical protein HY071_05460 [Chloroflexi bacterium]|nr:hypothetical protein [Chloroflexota bacterium]
MASALELRPGTRVRYSPAHSDLWREGTLVRPSPNGEEWLVSNELGRFWIQLSRLRPVEA